MGTTHKHVTEHEISKYLNADESSISIDTIEWYEDVGNRMADCKICERRLKAYRLITLLAGYEPETKPDEDWLFSIQKNIKDAGMFIVDKLDIIINSHQLQFASVPRSATAMGVVAAVPKASKTITLENKNGYFHIELSEQTRLKVEIIAEDADLAECKLLIFNDGEHKDPYNKCSLTKRPDSKHYIAITGKLEPGGYLGVVVEGFENE